MKILLNGSVLGPIIFIICWVLHTRLLAIIIFTLIFQDVKVNISLLGTLLENINIKGKPGKVKWLKYIKMKERERHLPDSYIHWHPCRSYGSRWRWMKVWLSSAVEVYLWWKSKCWLKAQFSSAFVVICVLQRCLRTWVR